MEETIYRKMYSRLFNRVTDAIAVLETEGETEAKQRLIQAQLETEELNLSSEEEKGIDSVGIIC